MSIALNGDGIISGVSSITVGAGASVFSPAANTLALGTNGSERVRIESGGNTDVKKGLRVSGEDAAWASGSEGAFMDYYAGGSMVRFGHVNGASGSAKQILFYSGGSEMARFTTAGNLKFPSGQGIDFSATADGSGTTTSELLDDYEEGTFTPTIEGTSTAGTASYAVQQANYTKIGNRVIINVYIAWSSGTGTGSLMVGGLPYTPISSNTFTSATIAFQQNITLTANNYMQGHVHNSTTKVYLTQTPTGGGALSNVAYDASGEMMVSAAYPVAS